MGNRYIIIITLLLLLSFSLYSKKESELWERISIDFDLAKRFNIAIGGELRFDDNFESLESKIAEIGLRYKLSKLLRFRVNFRYTNRGKEREYRVDSNILFNIPIKPFLLKSRFRIQKEFFNNGGSLIEFRKRVRIYYKKFKRLSPFIGGEIFLALSTEDYDKQNRFRLTVGTDWKIRKRVVLTAFYHFQKDLLEYKNNLTNIFGFKFSYSIK